MPSLPVKKVSFIYAHASNTTATSSAQPCFSDSTLPRTSTSNMHLFYSFLQPKWIHQEWSWTTEWHQHRGWTEALKPRFRIRLLLKVQCVKFWMVHKSLPISPLVQCMKPTLSRLTFFAALVPQQLREKRTFTFKLQGKRKKNHNGKVTAGPGLSGTN